MTYIDRTQAALEHEVGQMLYTGHLWTQAIDLYAALGVRIQDKRSPHFYAAVRWVGAIPNKVDSGAPFVVLKKLAALVEAQQRDGRENLILTPVDGLHELMPWQGGAALLETGVAVSKWPQSWDRLLALALLYQKEIDHTLQLHHAGFSFADEAARDAVVASSDGWMHLSAEDHDRHYKEWQLDPDGRWIYQELQYGFGHTGRHWDFVAQDPEEFLWWIAEAYGEEPDLWGREPDAPVGAFWVADPTEKQGFPKLGIMARPVYWDIGAN